MGTKFSSQSTSGYASASPPDDGSQVAANLITWSGVRTKLTDVLKTFAEAINTALVSALDLSARAISSNDTAIASDHWKTLQVTGATTIQLSSAASMGAGYEVGMFNAGASTVTVAPAGADTINLVSASVTVPIKGTMILRTNQALTGYNVVGTNFITPNLQFPATQVPSADVNNLDDYEEGTWTPGISFGGGTTGITYTSQTGQYTKIGRHIFLHYTIVLSSKGSSTGTANLTGFPFTVGASLTGAANTVRWTAMTTSLVNLIVSPAATGTAGTFEHLTAAAANFTITTETAFSNTTGVSGTLMFFV